ncbi:heme NO-binding domain-containing protein [Rapidithrix thailandica]|uniref:Heme NO-binding domain-containing protein n=1 Tax=Rapidithrix thailandica TaxID=413964 RepID=A0AAW9SH17_9BACT
MHGLIFHELNKYIKEKADYTTRKQIWKDAGVEGKVYFVTQIYPDQEIQAIVKASVNLLNISQEELLEGFGKFIVPDLLSVYKSVIPSHWKTLDILEHTENTMHKSVRFKDPNADPPKLICQRVNENEVIIDYSSERRMSDLGVGIAKGIAEFFQETIEITKKQVQKDGKDIVEIRIKKIEE